MFVRGLMFVVIFLAVSLMAALVIKVVWINLTPGQYVKYGCCGYGYLTDEQVEAQRKKINICPRIECKIEEMPGYRMHAFFNNLDFNK